MGAVQIADELVDGFVELGRRALNQIDMFLQDVGFRQYDEMMRQFLAADSRVAQDFLQHHSHPSMVKALAARLTIESNFEASKIESILVRRVLKVVLVEAACKREKWLIYVPFRAPVQSDTSSLIGSGMVTAGHSAKGYFDLNVTSNQDIFVTDIFDKNVYNNVGAPEMGDYEGWWRLRFVWEGKPTNGPQDAYDAVYNRFASIASLWLDKMFTWAAVLRYPISLTTQGPFFDKDFSILPKQYGPALRPHRMVAEFKPQLSSLWSFIGWFNARIEEIPKADLSSISLALDMFRSSQLAQSRSFSFVISEIIAEALLGEDKELSKTVSQRVAWVLGHDKDLNSRTKIFKDEQEYYRLRSQVVHGRLSESDFLTPQMINQYGKLQMRNRELLLQSLFIERDVPLREWAEKHLLM